MVLSNSLLQRINAICRWTDLGSKRTRQDRWTDQSMRHWCKRMQFSFSFQAKTLSDKNQFICSVGSNNAGRSGVVGFLYNSLLLPEQLFNLHRRSCVQLKIIIAWFMTTNSSIVRRVSVVRVWRITWYKIYVRTDMLRKWPPQSNYHPYTV